MGCAYPKIKEESNLDIEGANNACIYLLFY